MEDFGKTDKRLGMDYTKERTIFRVWSPIKDKIQLILYETRDLEEKQVFIMEKSEDGTHELKLQGDHKGKFYNYLVDGKDEVTDPYSVSSAINSKASAIIDLEDTDPKGFREYKQSSDINYKTPIIYEAHIKDFTGSENSGVKNRGKYLGFVEEGSEYKGFKTGIDHLKELGVTHIHLMPVYDFYTVDEREEKFLEDKNYNWGYDPELYNTPEGSYATNPKDPLNRIKELKTLIMKLQQKGFKVILDVVYNHTYKAVESNFNTIMPGYYYRMTEDGKFSDGTGTGNEIDTQNPMVRKFIIDSLKYWVEEYRVDGFRFDLLGLIDIDTTREIVKTLKEKDPHIFIYGEPWGGGKTTLHFEDMSLKGTQRGLGFSYFNDDFRNALKGDNNGNYPGFTQGNSRYKWSVELGIVGSIDYNSSHKGFTDSPLESINYVNSHDDLIIYDKILKVFPNMVKQDIEKLNRFAFSGLLTSQGIPFITSGNEFLRDKGGISNTYKSPLSVNAIDWSLKKENIHFFRYFKDLIKLRQENPEFSLKTSEEVNEKLKFMQFEPEKNIIVYAIKKGNGYILVVHNGKFEDAYIGVDDIIDFINYNYKVEKLTLNIRKILGIDGLEKSKYRDDLKELYIPNMTTYVYDIK